MARSLTVIAIALSALLGTPTNAHEGFVLKAGDGETVMNGIVIKVSPNNASTQTILAEQTFPRGGRTGLHIHDQGDEIFYVVSGSGTATLTVHGVANMDGDEPLVVIFFMDSPELADQFRAIHQRLAANPDTPITPDEWTELSQRFGGMRIAE
jgi:hypothetical protein